MNVEIYTVSELKNNFSSVLKKVRSGNPIAVSFGKSKQVVAFLKPIKPGKQPRRKLGILEGKGTVLLSKDFKISTEEFLNQ